MRSIISYTHVIYLLLIYVYERPHTRIRQKKTYTTRHSYSYGVIMIIMMMAMLNQTIIVVVILRMGYDWGDPIVFFVCSLIRICTDAHCVLLLLLFLLSSLCGQIHQLSKIAVANRKCPWILFIINIYIRLLAVCASAIVNFWFSTSTMAHPYTLLIIAHVRRYAIAKNEWCDLNNYIYHLLIYNITFIWSMAIFSVYSNTPE